MGILNSQLIKDNLIDKNIDVIIKETTLSTNDDAKSLSLSNKQVVVIAESQEKGRGRLNRVFYSPKGKGVYMSVLLKPDLSITDSVKITTFVAVACARVIERLAGVKVDIKWVNDLYINGKKVCGILTESAMDVKTGKLKYAVCGIGINCYGLDFPSEISFIATSIEKESGVKIDRNLLISAILNEIKDIKKEIESENYIKEYKARQFILNKEILVISSGESYKATALDITNNGSLIVEKNGEKITVNSGEVSIKV